jgi:putative DNA primase/helicase
MHLANAPQPGTGKSYLADLASGIATGERCAVVAFSPKTEETEKRLCGSALAGHPIIALDNASGIMEGDLLCQITERPLLQLRPLGTSKVVRAANTFTVLSNGNNAVVAADMVRRTIECRLDANMESPEAREFKDDPLSRIMCNRGTYVAACLTIARAYVCAGMPDRLPALSSYEKWSDLVRSPLIWLGRADPVASMAALRQTDPERQARAAVFKAWADELGAGGAHQTADLIKRANDEGADGAFVHPALRDALLDVARDPRGNLDPKRLGRWLAKAENNIAEDRETQALPPQSGAPPCRFPAPYCMCS